MIDWREFTEGFGDNDGGPGDAAHTEIQELNKALTAGSGQPVAGQAVAGALAPLMPQSLEDVLTSLTYTEADFPMWQGIYKSTAWNTTEEYNRLHRVGGGEAAFISEGDLPEEEDSTYSREVTLIKFLGTTRRVSHVASIVRTKGVTDAVAAETKNGTLWLMRQIEEALFFGDSTIVPEQFDGFRRLMIDGGSPIHDIRGGVPTEEILNGLGGVVREAPNYGRLDTWYMSIGAKSDLSNLINARKRTGFGEKVDLGSSVDSMKTQHGPIEFKDSLFIREGKAPFAAGVGKASKRPLTPSIGGAGLTSPAESNALWEATGTYGAGDFIYKIVAINRYGRSAPVTTSAVTVTAGDRVEIPIVDGGQGTTGYIVYRSAKNGAATTCKEAFRVARSGATQTIIDRNADLPGTSTMFGFTSKPATMSWKQLAPFTRIPLATVDTSIRWMQVIYGAAQLKAPRHVCMIKNVGRDPNSPLIESALPGFE